MPRRSPHSGRSRSTLRAFIVHDATGQALGYFYFEDEPGRRSAAKLLSKDEVLGGPARRTDTALLVRRLQEAAFKLDPKAIVELLLRRHGDHLID
jgi:hypothetical protein